MMRLSLVLAGTAVAVASCASASIDTRVESAASDDEPLSATTSRAEPSAPSTTSLTATPLEQGLQRSDLAGTTTTLEPTETTVPGPPPEGPLAPDFTLALGEDGGESFTLSQEAKPVFMVFWAEW